MTISKMRIKRLENKTKLSYAENKTTVYFKNGKKKAFKELAVLSNQEAENIEKVEGLHIFLDEIILKKMKTNPYK